MNRREDVGAHRGLRIGLTVLLLALLSVTVAFGGSVSTPNTFVPNTPALASEVNANFSAHEAAINDNNARVSALEGVSGQLHFPANALGEDPNSPIIQREFDGFLWQHNGVEGAHLTVMRPADWNGSSDVVMRLGMWRDTGAAGNVQFFCRPRHYAPGGTYNDTTGVVSDIQSDVGEIFDILTIVIPAARLGTDPYWDLVIQRNELVASPYLDDVRITTVELTYGRN